jgi:hypothetical protein
VKDRTFKERPNGSRIDVLSYVHSRVPDANCQGRFGQFNLESVAVFRKRNPGVNGHDVAPPRSPHFNKPEIHAQKERGCPHERKYIQPLERLHDSDLEKCYCSGQHQRKCNAQQRT